jgi:hypothetical protein
MDTKTINQNSLLDASSVLRNHHQGTSQQQQLSELQLSPLQWVDPSRRVILGAVMEILNEIGLDASLRDTVQLN